MITEGVINRAPKRDVLDKAWKEMLRVNLEPIEQSRLWQFTTQFYRHCVAAAGRETDVQKRVDNIYSVLRRDTPNLEHQKNEIADAVEFRLKQKDLKENLDSEANFFYCTAHANPAAGHAAYQDRIYYRKNGQLSAQEKKFVRSQKLLAVEDVVMGPVWLCTRRNCRHRLIPISFESAKLGDLRVEYKSDEISYEEGQYHNYRDRLRMLVKIKETIKKIDGVDVPAQMKVDIKRTYKLSRAWRKKAKKSGN